MLHELGEIAASYNTSLSATLAFDRSVRGLALYILTDRVPYLIHQLIAFFGLESLESRKWFGLA